MVASAGFPVYKSGRRDAFTKNGKFFVYIIFNSSEI